MDSAICILNRYTTGAPDRPPEAFPIGRAALRLYERTGTSTIWPTELDDGRATGWVPRPGRWHHADLVPICAVYDRYPSQSDPRGYAQCLSSHPDVPHGNPPPLIRLCRDKVECQRYLERHGVRMPALETDPARFADALERWGQGFAKPRYGSFGTGVRAVCTGTDVPSHLQGRIRETMEPTILQRAIPPLSPWASVSLRALVQRTPEGPWFLCPIVARVSTEDPVANVARGAEVRPVETLLSAEARGQLLDQAITIAKQLARAPDGQHLVELGIDFVVDEEGHPWPIEVNGIPRGRLAALAALTDDPAHRLAHERACLRPLETLAHWAGKG